MIPARTSSGGEREREREGGGRGRGRESDIHIKLAAHIRGGTAVGCTAVPS